MEIQLRKLKTYPSRSEETLNFVADVYIDGVKAGSVDNDGRGGSHRYMPWALGEKLGQHARTLPKRPLNMGAGRVTQFQPDADTLIDDAIDVANFDKVIAKRLLVLDAKGRVMQTKVMPPPVLAAALAPESIEATRAKLGGGRILNVLPREEALALFRSAAL